MEKEGILGHNPSGEFHWQSDPHVNHDGSITPAMEMNLDSGGDRRRRRHHHHLHHQLATNPTLVNLNNWEQSSTVDDVQTTNFESALSSLVSSPTSSSACNIPSESFAIRELIGRLGSICNGKSPPNDYHHHHQSGTNDHAYSSSCYSTPLNSPPKLNLSMPQFAAGGVGVGMDFVADPGFAERAARFSCFGAARNFAEFGQEPGKLSRVSSSQSLKAAGGRGGQLENDNNTMMMMRMNLIMGRSGVELGLNNNNNVNICNAKENPSPPERIATPCGSEGNPVVRKRKSPFSSSPSKGSRGKDASNISKPSQEENSNSKRRKSAAAADGANGDGKDAVKEPRVEQNGGTAEKQNGKDKENNARPPEHPKQDYIHVRARRGQATDSHSLAERVRREKISERMKFLQDLVPGCNKVTGKAVMLDEIINYVQSLQRQVEFLSMKLATVNPLVDGALTKDMHQPRGPMLPPHSSYPLEATNGIGFSCANQPQGQGPPLRSLVASNALEAQLGASCLSRSLSMQLPSLDGFTDAATSASQLEAFWEDDLQSVVQMGFVQNQEAIFSSQNIQGPVPASQMKIEL